jgi:hypothetical protein
MRKIILMLVCIVLRETSLSTQICMLLILVDQDLQRFANNMKNGPISLAIIRRNKSCMYLLDLLELL